MACLVCSRVADCLRLFDGGRSARLGAGQGPVDFLLGTIAEIDCRGAQCGSCRSTVAVIVPATNRRNLSPSSSSSVTAHFSTSSLRFFLLVGDLDGVSNTDFPARRANIHKLSHFPFYSTERINPTDPRGRQCDAATVSLDVIKKWIRCCDSAHEHSCVRKYDMYLLPTATLSFIDVENLCVVTPESEVRYVALSYVWGTVPVLRAIKSNIDFLCQPGSLNTGLPRTIRDAITLCSRLGIKYLWVDSLCIIQDDFESQQEQLRAMGSVYGKAYFTIAALHSEHANAGIYRVGPTDAPCTPQPTIRLPDTAPLVLANSPAALNLPALSASGIKWNTRGWTLQEHVFSRRILALGQVATWVCFGGQWTEDVEYPSELDGRSSNQEAPNTHKLAPTVWPSISAYSDLALEYATRDLTSSSDTVNAFAGIITPMSAWFPGGLLYGTAEFTFDIGMLWNPRRSGAQLRSSEFPSWSWISWKGSLVFNLWGEAEDYIYPKGPLVVKPLVKWEKQRVSSGIWVGVDNSYHAVRSHFSTEKNPPALIPDKWTRHVGGSGEVWFQTLKFEHVVPPPRFAYPIPPEVKLRDVDFEAYHPYLRFRGLKARVGFGISSAVASRLEGGGVTEEVDITTLAGDWAGRITLNLQTGDKLPVGTESVEVIAISEASLHLRQAPHAPFVFREVQQRKEPAGADVYDIVNVLWVGWREDGMAYRKALGRVWKKAWEGMVKNEVELLLA
ncbi:hypothetical protein OQA88_6079 [Cercophora sp. LCS_1]